MNANGVLVDDGGGTGVVVMWRMVLYVVFSGRALDTVFSGRALDNLFPVWRCGLSSSVFYETHNIHTRVPQGKEEVRRLCIPVYSTV